MSFLSFPCVLHVLPVSNCPSFNCQILYSTMSKRDGVLLCVDSHQHGILLSHPAGEVHPETCVWGTQSVWTAAHQGQVLELRFLQVHLCVWSHKCAIHGWSGAVVLMVLSTRVPSPSSPTLQGSLWICEYYGASSINSRLSHFPFLFSHTTLYCNYVAFIRW